MGVTHPRISHIEALAVVNQRTADRYLAALATCSAVDSGREAVA
jgi:hypothetical protein